MGGQTPTGQQWPLPGSHASATQAAAKRTQTAPAPAGTAPGAAADAASAASTTKRVGSAPAQPTQPPTEVKAATRTAASRAQPPLPVPATAPAAAPAPPAPPRAPPQQAVAAVPQPTRGVRETGLNRSDSGVTPGGSWAEWEAQATAGGGPAVRLCLDEHFTDALQQMLERAFTADSSSDERGALCCALRTGARLMASVSSALRVRANGDSNTAPVDELESALRATAPRFSSLLAALVQLCEQIVNVNQSVTDKLDALTLASTSGASPPLPEVAAESVRLLGALLSVPWWCDTDGPGSSDDGADGTGPAADTRKGAEASVAPTGASGELTIPLGVSERWAIVSTIMAMLGSRCDPQRIVQRQALKCLGVLLGRGSSSMCEMLLAHQLPSVLCDCVRFDGPREAEGRANPSGGGSYDTISSSSPYRRLSSFAIRVLALLVHPTGSQWQPVLTFPLMWRCVQSSNTAGGDGFGADGDALANRLTLRTNVHHAVCTHLMSEGDGALALKALCLTITSGHAEKTEERTEAFALRSAALRVFAHCAESSAKIARLLCDFQHGSLVQTMINLIVVPNQSSPSSSTETFETGLAILVIVALIRHRSLATKEIVQCIERTRACMQSSNDVRVLSAGTTLLARALEMSTSACDPSTTVDGGYGAGHDPDPNDGGTVATAVLKAIASQPMLVALRKLFSHFSAPLVNSSADEEDEPASMRAVAVHPLGSGANGSEVVLVPRGSGGGDECLDGSQFGARCVGMLDSGADLLARSGTLAPPLMHKLMRETRLCQMLCKQVGRGGGGELSPVGLCGALAAIRGLIEHGLFDQQPQPGGGVPNLGAVLSVDTFHSLTQLLEIEHLHAVRCWPAEFGGGSGGVAALLQAVCMLVRIPLTASCGHEVALESQHAMHTTRVLPRILEALRTFGAEWEGDGLHLLAPVDVLSRLVLLDKPFMATFLEVDGVGTLYLVGAFSSNAPPRVIVNALLIASQLARASEQNYLSLSTSGLCGHETLCALLTHREPAVRAKTCNLLGNLCRHSGLFYETLAAPTSPSAMTVALNPVLERLVATCTDPDPPTRKFACFAIGNAAFHAAELYAQLAIAVEPLVQGLRDSEEKTRANAAGALGNLVRNSDLLCHQLVAQHVPEALIAVACTDVALAPQRIALFSLGTLAVYDVCRAALRSLSPPLEKALGDIEASATDDTVLKYVSRVRKKLG